MLPALGKPAMFVLGNFLRHSYHFKVFNNLLSIAGRLVHISSNEHSNLLDFSYFVNLTNGRWLDFRAFETFLSVAD